VLMRSISGSISGSIVFSSFAVRSTAKLTKLVVSFRHFQYYR
jgi:hypothetical protein